MFCHILLCCLFANLLNLVAIFETVFLSCFFRNRGRGGAPLLLAFLPYPLLYFSSSLAPACLSGHSIAGTAVLLGVAAPP